ncbi:MAG: DUF2889 domain-containing protein [Acidimicrobiales bacterium]
MSDPLPPYRRTVVARRHPLGDGRERVTTRADDWFHGFEVVLVVDGGAVVEAGATSHRHPWTTCTGALPSVDRLVGVPLAQAPSALLRAGRAATCVHVNDLVWLAAQGHERRRYEVTVTPDLLTVERDDAPVLSWPLDGWIVSAGPFVGTSPVGAGFASVLDELGADADLREAVRVARRGASVGMGYFVLDWPALGSGRDVPRQVMADTCHAFSAGVIDRTIRVATPPG